MSDEVLVRVEGVSKKFCRSLKRSLWYGVQNIAGELLGRKNGTNARLRPDEFWAVDDVSFELRRGECLGLIGPNGAGKSTLLKLLNGLIKPDKGRIALRGRVGALIELGAGFNPILTGRENIYVNGAVLGFSKAEINRKLDAIIDFAEIGEFIDTPVQNYSSGMKVRLGFAVAAQMEPDVLIIDEVLAVGDVGFRSKCYNAIYDIARDAAVIFVSHNMHHINRLASLAMAMAKGKVVSFRRNVPEVIEKYFDLFHPENGKVMEIDGAHIYNIKFNAKAFDSQYEIEFGGDLQVEFDVKILQKHSLLEASISIVSLDMVPVIGCNSKIQRFPIRNDGKALHLVVRLPAINLTPGRYYISIIIMDTQTHDMLCWHHAIAKLKVKGNFYYGTLLQHIADWSIADVIEDGFVS